MTTNKGRCRFNPNIYASGKVCLSILGTWRGERGEQWSSAQGLESVLISIQSLMSSNPYENEPGYDTAKSATDLENMDAYVAKIRHETLRLAVIEPLELSMGILPDGTLARSVEKHSEDESEEDVSWDDDKEPCDRFLDLRKRRFLWYFDAYLRTVDAAEPGVSRNRKFQRMPFEGIGNIMDGHFDYPELRRRLNFLREKILGETRKWPTEGLLSQKQELGISANLQRQYEQIVEDYKNQKNFMIALDLVDGNPFEWGITYFGRPMTHLDGGIFKIKIYLSPRFPEEQPRVFMETPIFHVRVSRLGVLCYVPRRSDEMRWHIEAILATLEEDSPAYDPRANVRSEASTMFWGCAEGRRRYHRELRKSVEKSVEEAFA
ncbi:ubiquitin-conjugating enzyme E2 [Aspergillus candidus]|uniref:Ubiquitin conjugating enzyme n=1 Tax=Aspergillus candidus TaxID=41067 RepID=A0A2I2F8Z5_ASPCN|nr:ubiquitin conjugating enzyme [Aspergillus candidus]PLB37093.1 ubiquitin conjugating enzyme [Aspergillus candidus]